MTATMPIGRCYLVINPGSHHGQSRRLAARYLNLLSPESRMEPAFGVEPVAGHVMGPVVGTGGAADEIAFGYTRDLDDAAVLTHRALSAGYDTIVAVGGDGTINRVISALVNADPRGARARLGVLYSGTSPDFCRFHGLPTEPTEAVAALCRGGARPIDVGRIAHRDAGGHLRVDHFASSANIGLGAGIAARANRMRPGLGDFPGTLLATLVTIAARRPRRLRLVIDGEETITAPALNVTVGKNPYLASGLKLDTEIRPDDGRLYVFSLCGIGRVRLLWDLPRLYSGTIARDARFLLQRATTVLVEPLEGKLRTEFDGDPAGWCPAEIRVLPGAVQLIGATR